MRISDWSLDVCSSDLAGTDEAKPASRDLVVRDSQLPFHPRLGGVVAILGKQRLAALDRVAALLRVQTLPVALAQDHEVGVHPLGGQVHPGVAEFAVARHADALPVHLDRKSTRLNSSTNAKIDCRTRNEKTTHS